jgi:hypothetical protein
MKFLCIECDQAMKLAETRPPDAAGSLTVVFGCPACGRSIAMLTNSWETDMVASLGVRIGPAGEAAAAGAQAATTGAPAPAAAAAEPAPGASRCPFSGVVREMEAQQGAAGPSWTAAALARLEGIPEMVRPMARQGVEHYAASNGYEVVDERVLDEARQRFGM